MAMRNKDEKCTDRNILEILRMEMEAVLLLITASNDVYLCKRLSSNTHHTSLVVFKMWNWFLQAQLLFSFTLKVENYSLRHYQRVI